MSGGNSKPTADRAKSGRRTVAILVFDGVEALDVAGPAGVFNRAEALQPGTYDLMIASCRGGTIATSGALRLGETRALDRKSVV